MVLFILEDNIDSDKFILTCLEKYLMLTNKVNLNISVDKILPTGVKFDDNFLENVKINRENKPYLTYKGVKLNVCFNLSHTNGLMTALFDSNEVGIDCEKHKLREYDLVVKREFMQDENPQSLAEFYDIWTKKEAIIKYYGKSIADIKNIEKSEYDNVKTINIIDGYSISIKPFNNLLISILT